MDINRNNYEVYFLDYAEGNLSPADEEILHRFLKFNPDLSAELEAFSIHPIELTKDEYPNKVLLKKRFPEQDDMNPGQNFDMYCIAYLEGDLTNEQRVIFENYLAEDPDRNIELELYRKTVIPKETVSFPLKDKLKRRAPIVINWKIVMPVAAAAAILLMFIIGPAEVNEPVEMAVAIEQGNNENVVASIDDEKKPTQTKIPTTLKVIKSSKAPVPVSDYNKKNNDLKKEKESNTTKTLERKPKLAGLNLRNNKLTEVTPKYDQFAYFTVPPPSIHPRSLSAIDMARYQYQKASRVMEEDEVFIWNLASIGIKELNRITGSGAQLLASKDDEGSISGIQFKSRLLNITTPISRDD